MPRTTKLHRAAVAAAIISLGLTMSALDAKRALAVPGDGVADRVFGQSDFISGGASSGASGLNRPTGVTVDGNGRLYVTEQGNNRVLSYDSPLTSPIANRVFGQPDFTANTPSSGASGLFAPNAGALDSGGRLWVADYSIIAWWRTTIL